MTSEPNHSCPCCGFPTLSERSSWEICTICWWEDEGQDDPKADEVWGGANGHYSLTDARRNFADHGHMYETGHGIEVVENPSLSRLKLLEYVTDVRSGKVQLLPQVLNDLIASDDKYRNGSENV